MQTQSTPEALACSACRLAYTRTQVVLPDGASGSILAVGEAPGREEDQHGQGFRGQAGKTLDSALQALGIKRSAYARANIVRCRPPENRKPRCDEVIACADWLDATIRALAPRVLLAVGQSAAERLLVLPKGSYLDYVVALLDQADTHGPNSLPTYEGVSVVPMPHTSGLAWNRLRSDGTPIREIGQRALRLAVSLLPAAAANASEQERVEIQGDLFDPHWEQAT